MIWHVIKKDLRSQWWLGPILVVTAIGYFLTFDTRFSLPSNGARGLTPEMRLHLEMWPYVVAAFALARAVQLDSPASRRGDWHTRPMSRWSVLTAKVCLALGGVILPWGLIDIGQALSWQLSPAQAIAGAVMHMAAVSTGLILLMAIAAATSTLVQFLIAAAALLAAVMLILTPTGGMIGVTNASFPVYVSPGLVGLRLGLSASGAIVALFLLYHRRRLAVAWSAILLATIGVELAGIAVGLALWGSWPMITSAPAEAQGVKIEPANNPVIRIETSNYAYLSTPLKITKPDDLTLEIDRARIDRTWRSGEVRRSYYSRGGVLGWDMATGATPTATPEPVKIDAKYRLRVRRTLAPILLKGSGLITLPGGGSCRITSRTPIDPRAGEFNPYTVQCLSSTPLCLDVAAVGDDRGRIASGCGDSSRIRSGFYTQGFIAWTNQAPVFITRNQVLGMIDRSLSTGWVIPAVEPFENPLPRKPA